MSKTIHLRRASTPDRVYDKRDSTQRSVFGALFLVLFGFVLLAQHFAVGVHFDANFLAILLNDGFKVGAFFFPTDNYSALGLRLSSRLHRSGDLRAVNGLLSVFPVFRLSSDAECQAGAYRCYCE